MFLMLTYIGNIDYYGTCDLIYILNLDLDHNLKEDNIVKNLKRIIDNDELEDIVND